MKNSLLQNIVSLIRQYAKTQSALHRIFMSNYDDIVRLPNMDFLPKDGYIFDEEMHRWAFRKHGAGYEFVNESVVIDIDDYFLSCGECFTIDRLINYFESIEFDFEGWEEEPSIEFALKNMESINEIVRMPRNGYCKYQII